MVGYENVSRTIYNLRIERHLHQTDVAKALGVSREVLNHWESGTRQIKVENLRKLALYYNVSADYLLGLVPDRTTDLDMKEICKRTHLSELAIKNKLEYDDFNTISDMLENDIFLQLLAYIEDLEFLYNKNVDCINYLLDNKEPENPSDEEEFYDRVDDLNTYFQDLRMIIFEISELWSDFLESYIPTKELISDGKKLYDKYIIGSVSEPHTKQNEYTQR